MSLHFDEHNEGKSFGIGFGLLDANGRSVGVTVFYEHNPRYGSNDRDAAIVFAKTICDRFNDYELVTTQRNELLAACKDALETNNREMQHILDNGRLRDVLQQTIAKATGKEQV